MSSVKLVVDTVYTYVQTDSQYVHAVIDNVLKVRAENYYFSKAYREGRWDGYIRFYDMLRGRFLTGFLQKVVSELYDKGVHVEVENVEKVFGSWHGDVESIVLNGVDEERWRKTQLPVLVELLRTKRASIKMATGSGKTEVMAGILKALEGMRALVLVHRIELLQQMMDRLRLRLGECIGVISRDRISLNERIVVGMVQSIWAKKSELVKWLKNEVDVLIVDECHHCSSKTWSWIAALCNASWRYGFSGTPIVYKKERDMLLIGLTGEVIEGVTIEDLVSLGYGVKPVVHVVAIPLLVEGRWFEILERVYFGSDVMLGALGAVIRKELEADKKGIVVFVDRIRHGFKLTEWMASKGWKVAFACGAKDNDERLRILDGMRRGFYDVVVATTIFDEGIDVSGINSIVFWGSTKSVARVLQRIGRGVRVCAGKSCVDVWDFLVDNKYIKRHLKKRLKYYEEEKMSVKYYVYKDGDLLEVG
jgi:superfamily II DNA or RNA helicase